MSRRYENAANAVEVLVERLADEGVISGAERETLLSDEVADSHAERKQARNTTQVVTYDSSTGEITGIRKEPSSYSPGTDELTADVPRAALRDKRVDVSGADPVLVEDTNYTSPTQQFAGSYTSLDTLRQQYEQGVSDATSAKSAYQNATTDSERIDALAQYNLAQDTQFQAIAALIVEHDAMMEALYRQSLGDGRGPPAHSNRPGSDKDGSA